MGLYQAWHKTSDGIWEHRDLPSLVQHMVNETSIPIGEITWLIVNDFPTPMTDRLEADEATLIMIEAYAKMVAEQASDEDLDFTLSQSRVLISVEVLVEDADLRNTDIDAVELLRKAHDGNYLDVHIDNAGVISVEYADDL